MGAAKCLIRRSPLWLIGCHFLFNNYCNNLSNYHSVSNLPFLGNTTEKAEVGQVKETPGEQQHLSSIMLLTWTGNGNSTENSTGDLLWAMDKGHMLVLLVKLPVFVSQPNIICSLSEQKTMSHAAPETHFCERMNICPCVYNLSMTTKYHY